MAAVVIAETSDTPVWWLFIATAVLAAATGALALAAWKALGQLQVGLRQLALTVEQLEEAKKDRHIQVFTEFGRRWDEPALTEAQILTPKFSRAQLASVVDRAYRGRSRWNAIKNWRTQRANEQLTILVRAPNFYEDLAMVVHAGTLDLPRVSKVWKALITVDWDYWRPAMDRMREEDPYAFTEWEELVREMAELPEPVARSEDEA